MIFLSIMGILFSWMVSHIVMKKSHISLDPANLPDDMDLLKTLVQELLARLQTTEHNLHLALNRTFGRKSESISPDQMALFQQLIEMKLAQAPKPPQVKEEDKVKVRSHGRRKPPKNLPVQREEFPLSDDQKTCPDCGEALIKIGEETRNLVDYIPCSVIMREQVAEKWACKPCQGKVVQSELPQKPIERGLAGPGLLAQVVVSKFADHLPLYRQAEIFARQGFDVARSTLCDWSGQVAGILEPIWAAMREDVLLSKVIHTDDTPVPVLEVRRQSDAGLGPPDKPPLEIREKYRKARLGRLWVYDGDQEHPHTVYDYTPNRKGEWPKCFLGKWEGFLQADAYAGYDPIYAKGKVKEVACWAHTRRYFKDAMPIDKARGEAAMAFIYRLYETEWAAKEMIEEQDLNIEDAAKVRKELRQVHAKPVMDAFKEWLDAQAQVVLPKNGMAKAITYALNQWAALETYLSNGRLSIDNNQAERGMRCAALGRKNYLFMGSDEGGRRAAILYSFVASCKRHKIDPFAYLRDVIDRVATHKQKDIAELLPFNWAKAQTVAAGENVEN